MKINEGWRDVATSLPPIGDEVVVSIKDDSGDTTWYYTTVGWYSGVDGKWVVGNEFNSKVEYWRFLPQPVIEAHSDCWLCKGREIEAGDTLYKLSSWDGGVGYDYIHNIKYCPLCGRRLDGD